MSKIDDTRLQMYVDNELSYDEKTEVEDYIKKNQEARSLVESYKKINHLISSTYNQIKSDDLPKKTLDLLMDEKPNFLKQLMSYEVKLFPALGSVAALAIVVVMSLNFFKVENQVNPSTLMSENNRHVVLNQLQDILKDSEDNLNGILWDIEGTKEEVTQKLTVNLTCCFHSFRTLIIMGIFYQPCFPII